MSIDDIIELSKELDSEPPSPGYIRVGRGPLTYNAIGTTCAIWFRFRQETHDTHHINYIDHCEHMDTCKIVRK